MTLATEKNSLLNLQRFRYALFFATGVLLTAGFFILTTKTDHPGLVEVHGGQYRFVNPLLFCDAGDVISQPKPTMVIKKNVTDLVQKIRSEHPEIHISVYYRNLNNGPWFGINENVKFIPASLLKVQALLAVLKEVEYQPEFLNSKIEYAGSDMVIEQYFKPKEKIEVGKVYTVQELTEHMIRFSDNEASLLIAKLLGREKIEKTYHEIDIDVPSNESGDFMSVRTYSTFFRILYNTSYLRRDLSEAALTLLSQTDFNNGIVAGVPKDIPIAHKFGERISDSDELKQLHDCGIIYHPAQPYILCVMSRGSDFESLTEIIRLISTRVWETIKEEGE